MVHALLTFYCSIIITSRQNNNGCWHPPQYEKYNTANNFEFSLLSFWLSCWTHNNYILFNKLEILCFDVLQKIHVENCLVNGVNNCNYFELSEFGWKMVVDWEEV